MPFERTATPGLTVTGRIDADPNVVDLSTGSDWQAQVDESIHFPLGLIDDVFLHVGSHFLISPDIMITTMYERSTSGSLLFFQNLLSLLCYTVSKL